MSTIIYAAWTRGDILDLCIFVLLVVWFVLDRSNIYFIDIFRALWYGFLKVRYWLA